MAWGQTRLAFSGPVPAVSYPRRPVRLPRFLRRRHPGHFDLAHVAKFAPQLFPRQII